MNEDFVSLSLAKKLKEKGYPQVKKNTLAMYSEDGYWYSLAATIDEEYRFEDFDEYDCVCPTIEQVLKWLREGKDIHIEIFLYDGTYSCLIKSIVERVEDDLPEFHKLLNMEDTSEYATYEQAALAGIEYCLDKLI